MRAARSASAHRLAFVPLFVAAVLATGSARAWAEGATADDFIRAADPSVKAALEASDGPTLRSAFRAILDGGLVDHQMVTNVLAQSNFAPHAHDTIVALAKVQNVPGAVPTFKRVSAGNDEGRVRGAAFELIVGAALGNRLASLSSTVDGNEVDAVLTDGTIVEMKNDGPDPQPTLSSFLYEKAEKQLKLRGQYGDPVMLIINEPLSPQHARSFRKTLGKAASVLVLQKGVFTTQLDVEPETPMERTARTARASLRDVDQIRNPVRRSAARMAHHARTRRVVRRMSVRRAAR